MKRILLAAMLTFSSLFGASIAQTTVGYSYVMLNDASYQAIEIGTSVVLTTAKGTIKPYTAVEVSVPLFFDSRGSNIQNATNKGSGFGVGLQVPLIFGLDISGFYIQIMGGYNLDWLNEAVKLVPSGAQVGVVKDAKTKTISQGFIYGGGIGYNFDKTFSIGVRYISGSMNNEIVNDPSADIVKTTYKTNYHKIMALVGFKF